ncbi:MAG: DUF2283 domain-containing protein [Methanobrevibacter sp.]|nr:DUF2283 domain-containing protein [Methanobrevibacter sp.]
MKKYGLKYDYDIEIDALGATLKEEYNYNYSETYHGIIYDRDYDGNIVGIEILDASKVFDIEKDQLISPKIEIHTNTTEDVIKIYIMFDFENNEKRLLKGRLINEDNSPLGFRQMKYNPQ